MDKPFVIEQTYQASLADVWAALTDARRLRAWYFPQVQRMEPAVGVVFEFADDGSAYQKQWRVTQVVAGQKLAHSWCYTGYPGSSEVTFELEPEGTATRLTLTHTGLASFPPDPHFARRRFETGWQHILGSQLKCFLEKPIDDPAVQT
ncbi:SRPBCC family protein [Hymenobacter volaticus]|uniref:SRPBCC domain-containing protein n=1 Tax=Hymenobacter volaticus TaxID=2932254 RepID=A0ABY4GEX7_9BACT|nr:SRPBCC domain-containing protein [Hymenobacter volaticus]UOQ69407.1 SRPBCC domain-containing protein [Hymenobacter volaticus]